LFPGVLRQPGVRREAPHRCRNAGCALRGHDEVGAGYNRARQALVADGRQVCDLRHIVKRGPNGQAPSTVADIYGSTWLTSGAGSVVLTGEPGDPIINFRHVEQPANEVGPWRLPHHHEAWGDDRRAHR
jgi:hypothetical protein